jgi:hypothetical protein
MRSELESLALAILEGYAVQESHQRGEEDWGAERAWKVASVVGTAFESTTS